MISVYFTDNPTIAVQHIKADTEYLSSDLLKGRGKGTPEIRLAAQYIADRFEESGLKPAVEGTYFQSFPIEDQREEERNVVGVIPAKTETNQSIVFMAHYDGLGTISNPGVEDSIYNAALDNAVGVAAMIEIARQFSSSEERFDHNVVFIATAAEEFGIYGSKYYVNNPIYPVDQISLCLNIDGFNVSGPRKDYFIMPRQGIDFVSSINSVANQLGWIYHPPPWVDQMNTLFDTAPFLSNGIPAITVWTGNITKDGKEAPPPKFGAIHSPEDEINEHWNWEGIYDHLNLYIALAKFAMNEEVVLKVNDRNYFING